MDSTFYLVNNVCTTLIKISEKVKVKVKVKGEVEVEVEVEVEQTRHNFVGEIRIFSVKIRINPYPSFMHRCIAKTFTRFISR